MYGENACGELGNNNNNTNKYYNAHLQSLVIILIL